MALDSRKGEQGYLSGRVADSQSKGCGFDSWAEWWEEFSLQVQLSVLTPVLVYILSIYLSI